ncbi:unnamed protein product [Rotaria sp. Silwood2]|nr:unnamed protein product [Rotaria sp. Silwood2]
MDVDSTKIDQIVDYLKEGVVNTYQNDIIEDKSYESDDNDECLCMLDLPTRSSVDEQSSTCEPHIIFEPNEWVVFYSSFGHHRPPRLLEFLRLLLDKTHYASYASYTNRSVGMFKIHKPNEVAALWEKVKSRQSTQRMTYDKFARAIRWYYKSGIMIKTKLSYTFQFGSSILRLDEINNHITY